MIISESISSSRNSSIQISLVIPIYNQEKNAHLALNRIKSVLDLTLLNYEIVAINDGSIDKTLEILQNEQRKDSRIQVVSYFPNRGKGYAVKTGILRSKGKVVVFTDGDLDVSPKTIVDYIKELENCNLVIASKRHPLSKINAPASRKLLSRAFNIVVRILTGIKIKDTQSGLKAGNGDVLRTIFKVMLVKRYAFDVELLAIATALKLSIKEMPVEINLDRGFKLREIVRMFIDVLAISYRSKIRNWYHKQLNDMANQNQAHMEIEGDIRPSFV